MRLLAIFISLFLFFPLSAQKKEISQARSDIKNRNNLENAESSMRELLKDSANKENIKIYITLADAIKTQYEIINEKFYLNEPADTAMFFNTLRKMFIAYESLDSIDMQPDKKGRVKLKHRKKNAEYLSRYRINLYNGGIYFFKKNNFNSAYDLMDSYIRCKIQPLFSSCMTGESDSLYSSAAFWTMFCGLRLSKPDSILKYSDLALTDKKYRERAFVYMSEAYLMKRDTINYVNTLRRGFEENRKSNFFFTRLMDYYNDTNMLDSAMVVADEALSCDNNNTLFLFAKSNVLLNMGKYAECISISDSLIERNDTLPDVYLNAGVSYLNMALALENDTKKNKGNNKKILDYYKKALPYMEKYRVVAPDDKERWAPSLYNIYLKLNMGRKFEEISGILRKMRK